MRKVHPRMPATLSPDAYRRWLNPARQDSETVGRSPAEAGVGELEAWRVSKWVNRIKNHSPERIEPIDRPEKNPRKAHRPSGGFRFRL